MDLVLTENLSSMKYSTVADIPEMSARAKGASQTEKTPLPSTSYLQIQETTREDKTHPVTGRLLTTLTAH